MKFAGALPILLTLLFTGAIAAPLRETLVAGGRERSYLVDVPAGYNVHQDWPLVLVFHGGGLGSAAQAEKSYGFRELADEKRFIAVFPEGLDHHWNDGRNAGRLSGVQNVDDVGFVSALIDRLSADYRIDPKRIYASGISNGGIFSYTLAARLADRLAAIGPVAGALAQPLAAGFGLKQPVAVIAFHGTEDKFVPYDGGAVTGRADTGGQVLSVAGTLALFLKADGCSSTAEAETIPAHVPADGTTVRRLAHGGGLAGTEVVLYTIDGGGHTWPGAATGRLYGAIAGRTTGTINATRLMWDFFAAHPKP